MDDARHRKYWNILLGMIVGFMPPFIFMQYGCRTPSSVGGVLETIVRGPCMTLMLIPQLITNRFLSWQEISIATGVSWAVICGILMAIRQSVTGSNRRKFSALFLSAMMIGGIVICSWIVAGILCFPFGVCPFCQNLTSVASPSLADISGETGVRFPPGVRLLYSDYSSFQDGYDYTAKMLVPDSDIVVLKRSLPSMHRPSAYELSGVPASKELPWYDLRSENGLRRVELVKISPKGFDGNRSLREGELWLSQEEPGGAVL